MLCTLNSVYAFVSVLWQDGFLHILQVKGNVLEVTQTVELDEPASSMCCSSPDKESVLLATNSVRRVLLHLI